VPKTIL